MALSTITYQSTTAASFRRPRTDDMGRAKHRDGLAAGQASVHPGGPQPQLGDRDGSRGARYAPAVARPLHHVRQPRRRQRAGVEGCLALGDGTDGDDDTFVLDAASVFDWDDHRPVVGYELHW